MFSIFNQFLHNLIRYHNILVILILVFPRIFVKSLIRNQLSDPNRESTVYPDKTGGEIRTRDLSRLPSHLAGSDREPTVYKTVALPLS